MDSMGDQTRGAGRPRRRIYAEIKGERAFLDEFRAANDGKEVVTIDAEDSKDLADDWIDCMRDRSEPVYNAMRGYQVMVAIKLGVDSYREGRVMAFDPKTRQMIYPPARKEYPPAEA